jgi:hypothetical protein
LQKNSIPSERLDKGEIQLKIKELKSSLTYLESIKTEVRDLIEVK